MKAYESQMAWNHQAAPASTENPVSQPEGKSNSLYHSLSMTIIDGRVVHKPQLIETKTGKTVGHFSIAVNHGSDSVSFIDVETWNNKAKACFEQLNKGNRVIVQGTLRQERWEDKDGHKKSKIKVIANNVIFVPKVPQNNKND